MSQIEVSREMSLSPDRVWSALADLGSHPVWMKDAKSVVFTSCMTCGVGTKMEVATRVGPFRTVDVMEVVGWETGQHIDVVHQGLVVGQGRLAVKGHGEESTVTWSESIIFPTWLGGRATSWLASPVLRSVWRGNLARLERMLVASDS